MYYGSINNINFKMYIVIKQPWENNSERYS